MRKPFIAGNWKMNLTDEEALKFVDQVVERVPSIESVDYAVCGQAVSLKDMKERAVGTNLQIGAQNVHEEEKGAFTGEISASALTSVGVKLAIIGHSERREYYNDTDERINLKVKTALNHGITPILCVGEQLEEREAGRAESVVRKQLEDALDGIEAGRAADIVIAYEPVWQSERANHLHQKMPERCAEPFAAFSLTRMVRRRQNRFAFNTVEVSSRRTFAVIWQKKTLTVRS